MSTNFESLDGNKEEEVVVTVDNKKKSKTPNYIKEFVQEVRENPELKEELFRLSGSVKVKNTLSYGETGDLIQVEKGVKVKKEDGRIVTEGRKLAPTAEIIGYLFENIGDEPIHYETEVYKEVDGKLESEVVSKELLPGEEVALSRKYSTLFTSQAALSHKLANARVICQKVDTKTKEQILESSYITFTEPGISVHDADIKIPVADRIGEETVNDKTKGIYKVKPEYFETFAFLDIVKETTGKGKGKSSTNLKGAATADFIRRLNEKSMQ